MIIVGLDILRLGRVASELQTPWVSTPELEMQVLEVLEVPKMLEVPDVLQVLGAQLALLGLDRHTEILYTALVAPLPPERTPLLAHAHRPRR